VSAARPPEARPGPTPPAGLVIPSPAGPVQASGGPARSPGFTTRSTGPAGPPGPGWSRRIGERVRAAVDRLGVLPPGVSVAGAMTLTAVLWAVLQQAEPYLGHDESVYAGRARSLLTGTPAVGWMIYRPVGLPYLGRLALALGRPLGHDTVVLRLLGLVLVLLTLGVVYLVGSRVTTPRRAAVSVLVVVSGATFLRRLPEFLDDIPSAGMLLLTAYLVLRSRRPAGRWALPAAGAAAVVTMLLRYGAAAGLLAIAGAAVLVWGPRVWLRAWREVAGATAVTLLGLAPLAVYSRRETGSVIGLLVRAEVTAHRAYLGQGLVYYAQAYPAKLAGVVGAVVMTVALVATARTAWRLLRRPTVIDPARDADVAALAGGTDGAVRAAGGGRTDPMDAAGPVTAGERERLFLGVAAVAELLLLGLLAHGESRFALFTVLALVVLGVDAVAEAAGRRRQVALATTAAAALVTGLLTAVLVSYQMSGATANVRVVASVAERVRTDVAPAAGVNPGSGSSCLVVTRLSIEAGWASGCDASEPDDLDQVPYGVTVYVVTFPHTPGWSGLGRIRALSPRRSWTLVPVPAPGELGDAVVAVSAPVSAGGTAP
jgi:hypothetical protein